MLRLAVLAGGIALLVVGLALPAVTGTLGAAIVPVLLGLMLLGGTLFERRRYKALRDVSPPGWQATRERFIDPVSGDQVVVHVEPTTGERCYVRERRRAGDR